MYANVHLRVALGYVNWNECLRVKFEITHGNTSGNTACNGIKVEATQKSKVGMEY